MRWDYSTRGSFTGLPPGSRYPGWRDLPDLRHNDVKEETPVTLARPPGFYADGTSKPCSKSMSAAFRRSENAKLDISAMSSSECSPSE